MGPTWPYVDVDLRNAIDQGVVPGPRLMVAGNYVSATGGAGDARQFSIYVDVPTVQTLADGVDAVRPDAIATLAQKLFRGEPAIARFDWNFSSTHNSSQSVARLTGSDLHGILLPLHPGHG